MLVVAGPAWGVAPGQRLANYVAAHAAVADRRAIVGVRLDGGRTVVVNGQPAARDVTAVVLTRLPGSRAGSFAAQRLCGIAAVGVKRLSLRMIGSVEVRARDGAVRATSLRLGLPSCHRAA